MFTKKFIPLFAIALGLVLAVASSGFREDQVDDLFMFEYIPPSAGDYSISAVEEDTNWVFRSLPPECEGEDKACTIGVPMSFVNIGTPNTLKSTINIQAALGDGGNAYVSTTAAGSNGTIRNQDD